MDTLFHYCSSATFASIISRKAIWLSSLSLSNDTMEGRLVTTTLDRLLSQLTVDSEEIEQVRKSFRYAEEMCDGLGFCLSEKPDLLSQWRGYADDGQGFSIGFNAKYLEELGRPVSEDVSGFRLKKVLYKQDEHEDALKPGYEKIKGLIDSGGLKFPKYGLINMPDEDELKRRNDEHNQSLQNLWVHAAGTIFTEAHRLKSEAFSEEAEWRLVSYLISDGDDPALFRSAGNRLVPYREFELRPLATQSIAEVYVGPKNITPDIFIQKFLRASGFTNVVVKRSAATYR